MSETLLKVVGQTETNDYELELERVNKEDISPGDIVKYDGEDYMFNQNGVTKLLEFVKIRNEYKNQPMNKYDVLTRIYDVPTILANTDLDLKNMKMKRPEDEEYKDITLNTPPEQNRQIKTLQAQREELKQIVQSVTN